MKKWVISAIIYFLVVVGAYYIFTLGTSSSPHNNGHSKTEQHEQ